MSVVARAGEVQRIAPILAGPGAVPTIQEQEHRVKSELARELHDQVAQQLTAMLIELQIFARAQQDRPDVVDQLSFIHASTREVLNNIRQIVCDLRGQPTLAIEFDESIKTLLIRNVTRKTGVKTTIWVSPSWLFVALKAKRDGQLVVTIRDDGRGFVGAEDTRLVGVGILGMRDRAALLGGVLQIRSRRTVGTSVTATFPKDATSWRTRTVQFAS